jgi:hypothetical protein
LNGARHRQTLTKNLTKNAPSFARVQAGS